MMTHRFGVASRSVRDYRNKKDWRRFDSIEKSLTPGQDIEDDLLQYLADSLMWIESYNPSTQEVQKGLNFYGITVIQPHAALAASRIFESWAKLFECAPRKIELTGFYTTIVGKDVPGKYETLRYDQKQVTRQLRKVASFCTEVGNDGEDKYLLHLGI